MMNSYLPAIKKPATTATTTTTATTVTTTTTATLSLSGYGTESVTVVVGVSDNTASRDTSGRELITPQV